MKPVKPEPYAADQQLFPIRQDRIMSRHTRHRLCWCAFSLASTGSLQFDPLLIFALAALGMNILTGYAGSCLLLGSAFIVGAYAAYNFQLR